MTDQIINHEEAYLVACFKRDESNLARCYLDLKRMFDEVVHKQPLSEEDILKAIPSGMIDCLLDPYDAKNNGNEYSSFEQDIVRIARAIEQVHQIK